MSHEKILVKSTTIFGLPRLTRAKSCRTVNYPKKVSTREVYQKGSVFVKGSLLTRGWACFHLGSAFLHGSLFAKGSLAQDFTLFGGGLLCTTGFVSYEADLLMKGGHSLERGASAQDSSLFQKKGLVSMCGKSLCIGCFSASERALFGNGGGLYEGVCLYQQMDYGKGHHARKALLMRDLVGKGSILIKRKEPLVQDSSVLYKA
eukprot:1217423-Amphidinium_carterae.2